MNNAINETAKNPGLWVSLLGFMTPATAGVALVCAMGGIIYAVIKDSKKERLPTVQKPLNTPSEPLNKPLPQPLPNHPATAKSTVVPYRENPVLTVQPTVAAIDDETLRQETVRKYMSGLGKKSAAARARKREPAAPKNNHEQLNGVD